MKYRFGPRPGDVVTVKHFRVAYRLPAGLEDGDRVKLVAFDHGFWDCEKDDKSFQICMENIRQGDDQ